MAAAATGTIQAGTINVSRVLDERPLNGFQIGIVAMSALVALMDGFDTQSIGFTAPALTAKFNLQPSMLGPVFSAGLFGAMIGALLLGPICDRFGRKRPLILATCWFAAFTLATVLITSYEQLLACRFLAGLGLGGAIPCIVALTSEYVSTRRRSLAIATLWAAFPLGGMIGGFSSAWLIPTHGWQSVFIVGGIVPLVAALILALFLPESLRFLVARQDAHARSVAIMRKLAPEVPAATGYTVEEERVTGAPSGALFRDRRAPVTLLLWVAFFIVFMILAVITLWTPSLMRQMGLTAATGALLIGANNLGAAIGTASCGALLGRFNPFVVLGIAYVAGGALLVPIAYLGDYPVVMAAVLVLCGMFLGAASGGTIVLAAQAYPTLIRSTGVGWGMAMGRCGQVIGPLIAGAMVSAGLTIGPVFIALALASIVGSIAILTLKGALDTRRRQMEVSHA
jgi:AAHS family 4-hydroxybenzoate transporter-like MFS transporter